MPNAIIGFANFKEKNIDEVLYRHSSFANWRGIRQMLNWDDARPNFRFSESADLISDYTWRKGFRLLEKYDASFDLQVWPWQLEESLDLASSFPNISIILNHTGMPIDSSENGINLWKKGSSIFILKQNEGKPRLSRAIIYCRNLMLIFTKLNKHIILWLYMHIRRVKAIDF